MKRQYLTGMTLAALTVIPGVCEASDRSLNVRLRIPAVCEFSSQPVAMNPDQNVVTGSAVEQCNSSDGFVIFATHRPLDADEAVELTYAGRMTPLQQDGNSLVATRFGAKSGSQPFEVRRRRLNAPLLLVLAATPV